MQARPVLTGILSALLFLQGCATVESATFEHGVASEKKPWTHESFDAGDDRFMFAVFSDLYSGERDGVFAVAMAQLQLLRPEIILSVGDLINGGTEDRAQLRREWDGFDAKVAGMQAPVFHVGGNHDLTNPVMRKFWEDRYGARYYYFVYKNVLFLMLDSEDYEEQRMWEIYKARAIALPIFDNEPEKLPETDYFKMPERQTGAISVEQATYFRQVIADHPDVRWTFLMMHKPVWRNDNATEFQSIESSLADRPYTVINGHFHSYSLTSRNGRDYIHLGTTSGGQDGSDPMAFDHVTLVTMTSEGPSVANLRLEGILDKTGHVPLNGDDLCYQAYVCATKD